MTGARRAFNELYSFVLHLSHASPVWSIIGECRRLQRLDKDQIKSAFGEYQIVAENGITCDPKVFWQFVKAKPGTSRMTGCLTTSGVTTENLTSIVETFPSHFSNVTPALAAAQDSQVDVC
ncbi:hypothetical protein Trydic_g19632 [Trypoxylus dichotomus]